MSYYLSFVSRTQLSVLAGASDPKGPGESLVPIQTIVPHEAFDEITLVHNIALLKTSTPLRFSVTVQPICFPTPDFPGATLKKCFVAGWLDPRGGEPALYLRSSPTASEGEPGGDGG